MCVKPQTLESQLTYEGGSLDRRIVKVQARKGDSYVRLTLHLNFIRHVIAVWKNIKTLKRTEENLKWSKLVLYEKDWTV